MGHTDILNNLFTKYGLVYDKNNPNSKDNDVFVHRHYKIITRGGIQKIEKAAGIKCDIAIVSAGGDYCYVAGTGSTADGTSYKTLACANSANSTNAYYAEMAEKRCRSRLILTIAGLYELGVFGEDEADDFKRDQEVKVATYKR